MQSISIKKYLFYIFTLCFLLYTESLCHSQRTHQYIVREAYKLLTKYLGLTDVNYLKDKIGTIQTGQYINIWPDHGVPWSDGKVVAGAFREDEEDVVYKYGSDVLVYPTRMFWSTVTHFWQADDGDNASTNLDMGGTGIPNAYQKIMLYANGGWDLDMNLILYNFPTKADGSGGCATQRAIVTFHYNNLIDLFFNKRLFVTKVAWLSGEPTVYNRPILFTKKKYSLLNSLTYENFMDAIPSEILGRMCHLLGDMSVSAHVHNKSHSGYFGDDTDRYDDWMGGSTQDEWLSENSAATFWNATRVWNTFGNIMNPYVSYDTPLHHLMYTMNQITGHFSCDDRYGDDNFNSSNLELVNYFPYGILPTTPTQYNSMQAGDFSSMRDATFPHAIRATAGLLYWFAKESGLLDGYKISGRIVNNYNQPLRGITINLSNNGGSTYSDDDGNYAILVSKSWNGTVTPSPIGNQFSAYSYSYAFSPVSYSFSGISDLENQNFTGQQIFKYTFYSGWTWFNICGIPTNTEINSFLGATGYSDGDIIKSQTGYSQFLEGKGWVGQITNIEPTKMYNIKIAGFREITFNGQYLDFPNIEIAVAPGWNWVGYFADNYETITEALGNYNADYHDQVMKQNGEQLFYNQGWYNPEGTFLQCPGNGLMLFSNGAASKTFSWPDWWIWIFDDLSASYQLSNNRNELKKIGNALSYVQNKVTDKLSSDIGEIEEEKIIPTEYSLSQNYPNPFNPTTTIKYEIPSAGHVTLKVYDLLGREITTLVDEFKTAGNYSAHFAVNSPLSSGIYFYRLQAGNYSASKKFILMK